MDAVQPQDLGVTLLLGAVARPQGGGVVAAGLGHAGAAPNGADVLVLDIDLGGGQSLGVVGAHRADDDDILAVVGGVDAQGGVQTNDKGTDIQGGVLLIGDPLLIQLDQLSDTGQGQVFRHLGQGNALAGQVQPTHVVHGAEQLDGAVCGAVGFQTLEDLLGVMEDLGGWVDLEGGIGDDAGVMPALTLVIVHHKHVVGHILAEDQLGGVRLLLPLLGAGDLDLLHLGFLLK